MADVVLLSVLRECRIQPKAEYQCLEAETMMTMTMTKTMTMTMMMIAVNVVNTENEINL
jgi:hypothetical protein